MNKILLIIQREYLTRVKKRSFLLTTILVPLVIVGFYAAIIAIAMSDSGQQEKIAVIDKADLFNGKIVPDKDAENVKLVLVPNETEESFKTKYAKQGYAAYVYIPELNIDSPAGMQLHSRTSVSITTKSKIEKQVEKAIEQKRLVNANIDPAKYASIKASVDIPSTIDSENGGEKKNVELVAPIVAFATGILIYMILLIYGMMVMRGVMEEKTNRISEVIVSSVKPFQLMLGKIIGIGAVGITQFLIWMILIGILQAVVAPMLPSMAGLEHATGPTAAMAQQQVQNAGKVGMVLDALKDLPVGLLLFCFGFYFIGGYLMYASLFAAIGSVTEDQQDAQQLVFPVIMPIILGFVIMTKAVQEPNGSLALFGSMFPLTSPIVMMGRIPFGVPAWQIIVSMIILVLFFIFCTWLAGRIYRTGILMYGKKASWKEMMKWAFRKY